MYKNYQEMLEKAKSLGPVTISVAVAQDKEVLEAVKMAQDLGLVKAILVGDADLIRPMMEEIGLSADTPVIDEKDIAKAALEAVSLVHQDRAQILMKGFINTSDFLRAVLNKEVGLRTGRTLSHFTVFEIPGYEKLLVVTDGGMNVAPSLQEKKEILISSMEAMREMGTENPYVAVLTANEQVSKAMPATMDAQALVEMSAAGELPRCIIDGPIAFDVAMDPEAAKHKKLSTRVSGKVDLMLVPNIETGNVIGKMLIMYGKAKMVGIILGAKNPIVMTSRAETAEGKLNSIALARLAYGNPKK
ncbi:MAG: Phosphate butyryltransferase [Firmicutes bacterium]|nr:Phosphate butyryltransferase [Bacillota bacterium]